MRFENPSGVAIVNALTLGCVLDLRTDDVACSRNVRATDQSPADLRGRRWTPSPRSSKPFVGGKPKGWPSRASSISVVRSYAVGLAQTRDGAEWGRKPRGHQPGRIWPFRTATPVVNNGKWWYSAALSEFGPPFLNGAQRSVNRKVQGSNPCPGAIF
jgi:hypothetical protein